MSDETHDPQRDDDVTGGTDSGAPFTVELPNGQRLEIGDIPSGTIVEIATWRGPGAPDARTERMVIAVTPPSRTGADGRPAGSRRRPSAWVAGTAIGAITVAAAFLATPVDVTVPSGGDSVLGGRAEYSLVVSRPTTALRTGDAVVVAHPRLRRPVLGRVSSISGDMVLVRAGNEFIQIDAAEVEGDVAIIVPFVGAPLSWWRRATSGPDDAGSVD